MANQPTDRHDPMRHLDHESDNNKADNNKADHDSNQHLHGRVDSSSWLAEDLAVQTLLAAVPIPDNLNDRIKSRLRMAGLVDPCLTADARADTRADTALDQLAHAPAEVMDQSPVRFGERARRALLMLAMAAALAGLAYLANQWRQPNERDWLVQQCHSVLSQWEQDNPANLTIEANLSEVPSSVREQLARVTLRGTRSLVALGSKFKGSLYRLDAPDGHSLILLRMADLPVVRGLNSRFSVLPTPSGGWSLVALQLNNETYVLAAECTEQQLLSFIRRPVVT